ncbi:MAG: hypothetical protein ACQEP5_04010 [Actinomycetota bacterium]
MASKIEHNNRIIREIIFLVVLSLSFGFLLGLILAPQSGRKSRRTLYVKLMDFLDKGKFTLLEARVIGEGLLEKSKERMEEVSQKLKDKKEN